MFDRAGQNELTFPYFGKFTQNQLIRADRYGIEVGESGAKLFSGKEGIKPHDLRDVRGFGVGSQGFGAPRGIVIIGEHGDKVNAPYHHQSTQHDNDRAELPPSAKSAHTGGGVHRADAVIREQSTEEKCREHTVIQQKHQQRYGENTPEKFLFQIVPVPAADTHRAEHGKNKGQRQVGIK